MSIVDPCGGGFSGWGEPCEANFNPDAVVETLIAELEVQLASHQGEFLLVVERQEKRISSPERGCFPPPRDYYCYKEHIYLGLVSGKTLISQDGFLSFPTSRYATTTDYAGAPRAREGNLMPSQATFFHRLNQPLEGLSDTSRLIAIQSGKAPLAAEVVVGDQAVTQWFLERAEKSLGALLDFWELGQALDRPVPDCPELASELEAERGKVKAGLWSCYQELEKVKAAGHREATKADAARLLKRAERLGLNQEVCLAWIGRRAEARAKELFGI